MNISLPHPSKTKNVIFRRYLYPTNANSQIFCVLGCLKIYI